MSRVFDVSKARYPNLWRNCRLFFPSSWGPRLLLESIAPAPPMACTFQSAMTAADWNQYKGFWMVNSEIQPNRSPEYPDGSMAKVNFVANRPWTMAVWCCRRAASADFWTAIAIGEDTISGTTDLVGIGIDSNDVYKIISRGETGGDSGVTMEIDKLHHLGLEYDGSQIRCFLDGEPLYAVTPSGNDWRDLTTKFYVADAASSNNAYNEWDGDVGNWGYWQTRFSQAEWKLLASSPYVMLQKRTDEFIVPAGAPPAGGDVGLVDRGLVDGGVLVS